MLRRSPFHWIYLLIIFASGLAALLSGAKAMYYFFFVLTAIRVVSAIMLWFSTRSIYVRLFSNDDVVSTGDKVNLSYRITNGSLMPVAHAHIRFTLDERMAGTISSQQTHMAFFAPQETLPFKKSFTAEYRGYYSLGQVELLVSDPLQFTTKRIEFDKTLDITVYPKVVKLPRSLFVPKATGGTLKAQEKAYDDRTHILNLRNYERGDDLKNIHWKLSAKRDELMTREFHQTMSTSLQIYVDGFRGHMGGVLNPSREELLVSFVASYIKMAIDNGMQYQLHFNNAQRLHHSGSGQDDFLRVLGLLTGFVSDSVDTYEDFLNEILAHASAFEHHVFITPAVTPAFRHFLDGLTSSYVVYALACDDEDLIAHKVRLIDPLMGGAKHEMA